jgi:3-oxoacyl-[acyl-carrier-protein] synthase II
MTGLPEDVWITGIGLISSLGEGLDAHWQAMAVDRVHPAKAETERFAPFPVLPMVPLELDRQIPRKADQRQMETWQRLGTYAAGLALEDAGLTGDLDRLSHMDMIVAAGGGERDLEVDGQILAGFEGQAEPEAFLNERLANDLRPTLFLAQLSNLLAGNVSIVHKVTGSSRTFMGEELAGISAVEIAARRIRARQGNLFLVGAAYNAERKDMLLSLALGHALWKGEPEPVWARAEAEGGMITGSVGVFLVLESRAHAEARGRTAYAKLGPVLSGRSRRKPGDAAKVARAQFESIRPVLGGKPVAVLSGANGISAATQEERALLQEWVDEGVVGPVRASQSLIGTSIEAAFPAQVALAALAIARKDFYLPFDSTGFEREAAGAPDKILATTWGFWRGEGMALVEAAD